MQNITTTFVVPDWIRDGLAKGLYEREGGVVRESGSKQVVAWLREASGLGQAVPNLLQITTGLSAISAVSSVLTLGVSVIGFMIIGRRLKELEQRLQVAQELLQKIDRKIDIDFYANFQAALDMARHATSMSELDNRRSMAIQAIDRFLAAQHVYAGLVDDELKFGSSIADAYLLTLALAYVAEARCHLEIGERITARDVLQRGELALRDRIKRYIETRLTSKPAMYLQPSLKEHIDLQRLTQVYQWMDPTTNENTVFSLLRDDLYNFRPDQNDWIQHIPAAIAKREEVRGGRTAFKEEVLKRLPTMMSDLEAIIETHRRFKGYQVEVESMISLDLSFAQWQQLVPENLSSAEEGAVVYLIPEPPLAA